jgi:hypothetical protein
LEFLALKDLAPRDLRGLKQYACIIPERDPRPQSDLISAGSDLSRSGRGVPVPATWANEFTVPKREVIAMSVLMILILAAFPSPLGKNQDVETKVAGFEMRLAAEQPMEGWVKGKIVGEDQEVFLSPTPALTAKDIDRVSFYDDPNGEPCIGMDFTDAGSQNLWTATSMNVGKRLAIVLDGQIIVAPRINAAIRQKAVITGDFDDDDLLRFFKAIVLHRSDAE